MVTLVNRAKMATSTTGTGTITLGSAVTGFQTFADAGITNGMTVRYVIENGDNFEIGSGTYTAIGTTLSRTVSESSNSDSALNLSGSSEVFLTAIAADFDAKLDKTGGTMTGVLAMGSNAITTSSTVDGRDLSADGTKLDGIEASATADQTDAEIRAAVEAASDSNVFTDADHSKLNGIEASADVTDATNVAAAGALMDSEVTNLAEVKAFASSDYATAAQGTLATNALPKSGGAMTGAITTNSTFDGRDVATDGAKLDGIEANATADQTDEEIQDIVGAMVTGNTETGITVTYQDVDGTLDFSVASQTDNNFTTTLKNKLDAIEASADVTDATNVTAAGALMDSEVTNLAQVKAFDSSDYATAAQGTTADAALPKSGGAMTGALSSNSNITTSGNLGVGSATGTINGIHVKSAGTDVIMNETIGSSAIRILGAGGLNYIQSGTSTSSSNAPIVFTAMNGGTEYARIESGETKVTGNIVVTGTVDGRDVATDGTKLDTIETNADVTDTANVTSAGALMDSECASLADVKALNQSLVTTATPTFARLKLTQTTVAANSSATTLDFSAANNFLVNMSADTTFTWSNLSGAIGCSGNIVLVQDATGGRDFTLPSEAKTPINGATIVQNTGANEIAVLSYYVMSSSQVLVNYIGDFA